MKVKSNFSELTYYPIKKIDSICKIKDYVQNGKLFCTSTNLIQLLPKKAHTSLSFQNLGNLYGDKIVNTSFAGNKKFIPIPIKQHLDNLEKYKSIRPKDISESSRIESHGVINLARLIEEKCLLSIFPQFARTLSFVWIGLSRGRMHFDIHNNFLCQISGHKDVVIIPPEYTKLRGGEKYLNNFSIWEERYQPSQNKVLSKFLGKIPHYLVSLKPGDCVFIPSGAYHAPFATTFDSISVNAFLIPKINYKYRKYEMHEKWPLPIVDLLYRLSYFSFKYFGLPLRQGAFELI